MATHISLALVFVEGLVSFLSPCVLPIIPIYMGYLAGNSNEKRNSNKKVLLFTISFIFGILLAIFLMNASINLLQSFLKEHMTLFVRIGGILIVLLGIYQLGFIKINFLQRTFRFSLKTDNKMNVMVAFIMGFTFSFAWTPCVGPALSSVLILASSAKNAALGNLLVLLYTVGFTIPFLLLGIFTTQALNFIKKNKKIMKYTIRAGGVIMIIMGVMTFTGWVNNITGYLSSTGNNQNTQQEQPKDEEKESDSAGDEKEAPSAVDFELVDQYGNTHKLSDYKGKVVFLNFWATWCPPCKMEMPNIEELYKKYNYNKDDVVILGVAQPGGQEKSISGIKEFINSNGYTFPTVFDESGDVFGRYYIRSLPTTFMIDKEGKIYGYVSGALSKDQMNSIINQTIEKK